MTANQLSARQAAKEIAAGKLKAVELVETSLSRIEKREPEVQAWEHLDREAARRQARACDAEKPRGPLHGVPVGVKDIIDTADMPTTYGCPGIYKGHRPMADAACVALVRRAGGIVMGKTVTTEFASSPPARTRNPLNLGHTPGGSSSGSAAAVADFQVPIGFATQTAGSVIRPAAFCGCIGFKPSYGTYAVSGTRIYAQSLDTLGTITRNVDDALLMWEVLHGAAPPATPPLKPRPRIGLCYTPFWGQAEKSAADAFQTAGRKLAAAGFDLDIVELPSWFETLGDVQRTVGDYECARSTAFECAPERFKLMSPAMQALRTKGWAITPAQYLAAREAQLRGLHEFDDILSSFDALMMPSTTGEAPKGLQTTGDPVFNRLTTLLHVPTIGLPVAAGPTGLPVGVQFVATRGTDLALLRLAAQIEESLA